MPSGNPRPDDERLAGHREDLVMLLSIWSVEYRSEREHTDGTTPRPGATGESPSDVELPGAHAGEEGTPLAHRELER